MIFAGESGGRYFLLDEPLSVVIEQETDTPCDSLTAVFAYSEDFPNISKVYILDDGTADIENAVRSSDVIFAGLTDETVLTADSGRARITLYARSLAALMTDNECEPVTYTNPSLSVILSRHAQPFGIRYNGNLRAADGMCRPGKLSVKKGCSHYKAAQRFCSEFLGSTMRVDHTGSLTADVFDSEDTVVFDNFGGTEFDYIKICDNRYSRISEIIVSDEEGFCMRVKDSECGDLGIERVRYLNLLDSSTGSVDDADRIIAAAKNKSFTVQLKCSGCIINRLGAVAYVNADRCRGKKFRIQRIKYTADSNGENTQIKLITRGENDVDS